MACSLFPSLLYEISVAALLVIIWVICDEFYDLHGPPDSIRTASSVSSAVV